MINGDTIYFEPYAFDILTGEKRDFEMSRTYNCGIITSAKNIMLYRSGTVGYLDPEFPRRGNAGLGRHPTGMLDQHDPRRRYRAHARRNGTVQLQLPDQGDHRSPARGNVTGKYIHTAPVFTDKCDIIQLYDNG